HRTRAVERQLLDEALGHVAAHRPVGVPFDHDARRAELPGELAHFLDDEADVRIVELLDLPPALVAGDLFVEIPRVREEMDHDRLGEDLVLLALDGPGGRRARVAVAGAKWTSYSFFWLAYFGSDASFWMIEKSIT